MRHYIDYFHACSGSSRLLAQRKRGLILTQEALWYFGISHSLKNINNDNDKTIPKKKKNNWLHGTRVNRNDAIYFKMQR